MAEWSKAHASGACPKGLGFEPQPVHFFTFSLFSLFQFSSVFPFCTFHFFPSFPLSIPSLPTTVVAPALALAPAPADPPRRLEARVSSLESRPPGRPIHGRPSADDPRRSPAFSTLRYWSAAATAASAAAPRPLRLLLLLIEVVDFVEVEVVGGGSPLVANLVEILCRVLQTVQTCANGRGARQTPLSVFGGHLLRNGGSAFRLQNMRLAQLRSAVQGKAGPCSAVQGRALQGRAAWKGRKERENDIESKRRKVGVDMEKCYSNRWE